MSLGEANIPPSSSNRIHTTLFAIPTKSMLVASAVFVFLALLALLVGCSLPFSEPPPAPSPSPTLDRGTPDGDSTQSAISGTVTNLSSGQPGAGIEVSVSGFPSARTDSKGHYSVTGLSAGEYSVALKLHGQGTSAQGAVFVNVDGQNSVTIDLAYYNQPQPLPTDTPQPEVVAAATPLPRLPVSGKPVGYGPLAIVGLGFLLTLVGGILRLGVKQP